MSAVSRSFNRRSPDLIQGHERVTILGASQCVRVRAAGTWRTLQAMHLSDNIIAVLVTRTSFTYTLIAAVRLIWTQNIWMSMWP